MHIYLIFVSNKGPWDAFTNWFMNSWLNFYENYLCIDYNSTAQVRSQICKWHDSWDIMTYAKIVPDSKVRGANLGPIWVLAAPGGPHVGPMNLAIRGSMI